MSDIQTNALSALTKFLDAELAAEDITPEILDYVMLEVEYSPVIPYRGGGLDRAVDVIPYGFFPDGELPDRFEVPGVEGPVNRDGLKIMRARYPLARDKYHAPQVKALRERLAEIKHSHEPNPERTSE